MSALERLFDNIFSNHRWLGHVFFWLVILGVYVIFFGRANNNYLQTLFFVGLILPVTIITTYFLNYFLVPRFLLREKYFFFLLYLVYTLLGSIFLETMIVVATFMLLADFNVKNMSPASIDTFFLITSLLMVAFFGMSVKLVIHWRESKTNYQKLLVEKVETELKFLKAQLNPHFLFNTLNNLYFLTIEKSERAPVAILQLSDILDYALNTQRSIFVPVETEWGQVMNFVALESMRCEDRIQIETEITGPVQSCKIAPMLLMNLVENAFKHGVLNHSGPSWIQIRVTCSSTQIEILVGNKSIYLRAANGIGLENLQQQLELLYKDRYHLIIDDAIPGEYFVKLTIQNKDAI